MGYEIYRLDISSESQEAGQANEKMKLLALNDRSTLYQGYSTIGYVYFSNRSSLLGAACPRQTHMDMQLRVLVALGDPSKDWGTSITGKIDTYRSPLVCECDSSACNTLSYPCTPVDRPTNFKVWPRTRVPANPASCLLVYSTDAAVNDYAAPGQMFGIDFIHEPM